MVRKVSVFFTLALMACSASALPVARVHAAPEIYAEGVLAYTNAERYREGLPFLASNAQLSAIALEKLQDLFARQYFAHESPTGESVADLAKREGYAYITVGENLALGNFGSSRGVVDAWMDSPGHRANILKDAYTEIGIAAGQGLYEGRRAWIVVQEFGRPLSSCPRAGEPTRASIQKDEEILAVLRTIAELRQAVLRKTAPRSPEYAERLAGFTKAADLYNARVEAQRARIEEFNKGVEDFNACVTGVTHSS